MTTKVVEKEAKERQRGKQTEERLFYLSGLSIEKKGKERLASSVRPLGKGDVREGTKFQSSLQPLEVFRVLHSKPHRQMLRREKERGKKGRTKNTTRASRANKTGDTKNTTQKKRKRKKKLLALRLRNLSRLFLLLSSPSALSSNTKRTRFAEASRKVLLDSSRRRRRRRARSG